MNEVLETRYGKLIANTNDVYIGRMLKEYGEFSEGEVELFRSIITKDMIVVDVGANIGAHTLVFSQLANKVVAVEPQREIFYSLCGMCALNNLHNVICLNVAAGDENKMIPYAGINTETTNNMGGFRFETVTNSAEEIACVKMEIPCNFMKVDVEGMEREVLVGAEAMIRDCKPILYLEADRSDKVDALIEKVEELGYHPYWHIPALYNPRNFKGNTVNRFKDMASFNILCAPHNIDVPALERAKVGDRRVIASRPWNEESA